MLTTRFEAVIKKNILTFSAAFPALFDTGFHKIVVCMHDGSPVGWQSRSQPLSRYIVPFYIKALADSRPWQNDFYQQAALH